MRCNSAESPANRRTAPAISAAKPAGWVTGTRIPQLSSTMKSGPPRAAALSPELLGQRPAARPRQLSWDPSSSVQASMRAERAAGCGRFQSSVRFCEEAHSQLGPVLRAQRMVPEVPIEKKSTKEL